MVHAARASESRATAPPLLPSTRHFLIAGEKILKTELTPSVAIPNVFLIAGVCPAFSPAAAPRISNRYTKLLEIELTRSQQTRKHFLIATICPTFTSAPPLTHYLSPISHRSASTSSHWLSNRHSRRLEIDLTHSQQTRKHFLIGTICPTFFSAPFFSHSLRLITHHCLTPFLFDTNKPHKIITLMKRKEKPHSIRYKFALRATHNPILAASRAVFYTSPPLIASVLSGRTVQTRPSRARLPRCELPDAMAKPEFEEKGERL